MTTRKKFFIFTPIILVLILTGTLVWGWFQTEKSIQQGRCMAMVRVVRTTIISVQPPSAAGSASAKSTQLSYSLLSPSVVHNPDSIYREKSDSERSISIADTLYLPAVWVNRYWLIPSCRGRLAVPTASSNYATDSSRLMHHLQAEADYYARQLAFFEQGESLRNQGYTLDQQIKETQHEMTNLHYYLRVHGVQDEGYHEVARYAKTQESMLAHLQEILSQRQRHIQSAKNQLQLRLLSLAHPEQISLKEENHYTIIYTDGTTLRHADAHAADKHARQGYTLLQLASRHTPDSISPISLWPWVQHMAEQLYVKVFDALYGRYAITTTQPADLCITPKMHIAPLPNVPHRYTGYWITRQQQHPVHAGWWKNGQRQGEGMAWLPDSMLVQGCYAADTLGYGRYALPDGSIYTGCLDSHGAPHGHGTMRYCGSRRYCGSWNHGQKEGFGIQTGLNTALRVGEWHNDSYKGERLVYTSDRIYGIDISRFQHEVGKKKYAIDWKSLRISHLGTSSRKKISGTVAYPISFIYIKATEGTTLRNKYYAADYRQARTHGIYTGAYHFFSTSTKGAAQARHFLRYARLSKGDLPPVLDVEPTPAQIKQMGGPAVLWREVRAWLQMVEKRCGVAPVLYISQMFVNNYLPYAPDIKQHHHVWIARYGEYKPDVRLAYWQLCPDGRVNGIRTEVDINVFNGYREEFDRFVTQNHIR